MDDNQVPSRQLPPERRGKGDRPIARLIVALAAGSSRSVRPLHVVSRCLER
jgi:hypothetical protein